MLPLKNFEFPNAHAKSMFVKYFYRIVRSSYLIFEYPKPGKKRKPRANSQPTQLALPAQQHPTALYPHFTEWDFCTTWILLVWRNRGQKVSLRL
jgi:hypothetical protein